VVIFEQFYRDSFFFAPLLALRQTLAACAGLGELWQREFFLDMGRAVQVPIELSLPWLLAEHLVGSPGPLEGLPRLLDLYGDAAHSALYGANRRFLFDEAEAELNLALDQLLFLLAHRVYSHFRALAAASLLEPGARTRLEGLRAAASQPPLWQGAARLQGLLGQRHLRLLGRCVDLRRVLGSHVADTLHRDLLRALKSFEAADLTALPDLAALLAELAAAHRRLAAELPLPPWALLLARANLNEGPRGRVEVQLLGSLHRDLLAAGCFNAHTQRFTTSPAAPRPSPRRPRSPHPQALGPSGRARELGGRLTRGFFGRPHLQSLLALDRGLCDPAGLAKALLRALQERLPVLCEYLSALGLSLPAALRPPEPASAQRVFCCLETRLRPLLAFDDLKPGAFQLLRFV